MLNFSNLQKCSYPLRTKNEVLLAVESSYGPNISNCFLLTNLRPITKNNIRSEKGCSFEKVGKMDMKTTRISTKRYERIKHPRPLFIG